MYYLSRHSDALPLSTDKTAMDRGSLFHEAIADVLRSDVASPEAQYHIGLKAMLDYQTLENKKRMSVLDEFGNPSERLLSDSAMETASDMLKYYLPILQLNRKLFALGKEWVERVFSLPIVPGGVSLTGYIDAVVKTSDGRTLLIDWKTRANMASRSGIVLDKQLYIYAYALQQMGIKLDGALQVQLSTQPPKPPRFKKDGELDGRSPMTTKTAFLEAVADKTPAEQDTLLLKFADKIKEDDYFVRYSKVDLRLVPHVVDGLMNTIVDIQDAYDSGIFPRAFDIYTCGGCEWREVCYDNLKTGS